MVLNLVKSEVKLLVWKMASHWSDSSVIHSVCIKMNTEQYVLGPVDLTVMELFMTPTDGHRADGHKLYR